MNINHVQDRIGDTIMIEPALTAFNQRHGEPVNLYVRNEYRCLFEGNEALHLVEEPFEKPDFPEPCCHAAFNWAHAAGRPFAAGYFHQLRLQIEDRDRLHYRYCGPTVNTKRDMIIIAPFARSCASHRGGRANLQPPVEWWKPIVDKLQVDRSVVSLGDTIDPPIPGTINLRGESLYDVMEWLQEAEVVISVETGLLHLAGGVGAKIVFLSSATPPYFSKPFGWCEVVRAAEPLWDTDQVLQGVFNLLS